MPANNYPQFDAAVSELTTRVEGLITRVQQTDTYHNIALSDGFAQDAAQSATAAATSATGAASSAATATTKASAASSSATAAATSAATATTKATESSTSATGAATSATKAQKWAEEVENTQVETGKYSAKHHAAKASVSAATATTKAAEASSSATSAATSATTATTKASEAAASATNAGNSAASAATKATEASTSASNAAASATTAATKATEASTSATGAAASAATATTKATEAASSATGAASSATTASTKATEASGSSAKAQKWADEGVDVAVEAGKYSAKHHATKASSSAAAAATSESAAYTSKQAAQSAEAAAASSAAQAQTYRDQAQAAAASLTGNLVELGGVDLSSGTYPAKPVNGAFWKVTVGGTAGGTSYGVGDTLVYSKNLDQFYKIDNTESVSSVNGETGVVTVTPAKIGALPVGGTAAAASKLATQRLINGVGFDGTANITVEDATKQPASANLTALSSLVGAANKGAYFTAAGAMSVYDLTVFGRQVAACVDNGALRTLLALGSAATREATTSATDTTSERLWRTNDLVKQSSATDLTAGRVLLNGAHGLGGATPTLPTNDYNELSEYNGYARNNNAVDAINYPPQLAGARQPVAVHNVRFSTGYGWQIGVQTAGSAPADANLRAFLRMEVNSAWGNWAEMWHSKNMLALGTTPDAARAAMGLGSAALLTATSSIADQTAGRALKVGDFNLGTFGGSPLANAGVTAPGLAVYPTSDTTADAPNSWGTLLNIKDNSSGHGFQLAKGNGSGLFYIRGSGGTTPFPWETWKHLWHSGNLVKQASPTDATAGAMLAVGAGGLLSTAQDIGSVSWDTLGGETRFVRGSLSVTTDGPFAGAYWLQGQYISTGATSGTFLGSVLDTHRSRMFSRAKSNGVWGGWTEFTTVGSPTLKSPVMVVGTASGDASLSVMYFYDADGTTRRGFVGDATSANDDMCVGADTGDIVFYIGSSVVARQSGGTFSTTQIKASSTAEIVSGIELGRVDGAYNTPFIDFHANTSPTDYDVRLLATNGGASPGTGNLLLYANNFDVRRGFNGGYNGTNGTGTNWATPIWSMGSGYSGSGSGTAFASDASHYGLAWVRATHAEYDATIGEGLYVYSAGVLRGGIGNQSDTGQVTLTLVNSFTQDATTPLTVRRVGKVVTLSGAFKRTTPPAALVQVTTVPAGLLRPDRIARGVGVMYADGLNWEFFELTVDPSGVVNLGFKGVPTSNNATWSINVTWMVP